MSKDHRKKKLKKLVQKKISYFRFCSWLALKVFHRWWYWATKDYWVTCGALVYFRHMSTASRTIWLSLPYFWQKAELLITAQNLAIYQKNHAILTGLSDHIWQVKTTKVNSGYTQGTWGRSNSLATTVLLWKEVGTENTKQVISLPVHLLEPCS
jgi:hypothetical protein